MNRRKLKKQIPDVTARLISPTRKYLAASDRVSQDTIFGYQRAIEIGLFHLMKIYLTLDPSWPHRERWLDGFSEDFSWERNATVLHGRGELSWGHTPEVGREITRAPFTTVLALCPRHGLEYRLQYANGDDARNFSSRRWCSPLPK